MKYRTKKHLFLPVLIIATLLPGHACKQRCKLNLNEEQQVIHQRSKELVAYETDKNIDAALSFYAEDAIIQPANSVQVQGKKAIANLYNQVFENAPIKEFSGSTTQIVIAQCGDLAYEYGVNRIVLSADGADYLDMGKYMVIWKRLDNKWYVAALSFSSDAPEPSLL